MISRLRFLILILVAGTLTTSGLVFNAYHLLGSQNLADAAAFAGANASSFGGTLAWVIAGGYILMFIAMFLEGPVVTAAGAFAAALGFFNIWIVVALAILGDLVADLAYYALGYVSRITVLERHGRRFGLSRERMQKMEHLLRRHPGKTLVAAKLAPLLAVPGLMMAGATKMPFRKFGTICTLIILPKVILFTVLGYFFGRAYDSFLYYIQNAEYLILFSIVVTLIVYYIYKKTATIVSRELEPI